MAKKSKNNNTSTDKRLGTISDINLDGGYSWRQREVSETYLDDLADQFIKWYADHTLAITIEEFLNEKKILRATFNRWKNRNKNLEEAYDLIMQELYTRRDVGASYNNINVVWAMRMHSRYDKSYRQTLKDFTEDTKAPTPNQDETDKKITVEVIRK